VTALQTEIRLIVGRLEDFAAKIDAGLEDSDWLSKREMIRALVKRVEVTPDRVNVVFRVDSYPGEASPEKKSLQLRRGSSHSSLWRAVFCWPTYVPVYHPRFEPLLDRSSEVWACVHLFQEGRLIDAVKRPNTFIPLSTTHRETTGQKSRSPTLAIRSAVAVLCCSRPARARTVWAIALSPTVTPWSCGFRRRPPIWSRHRPRLHPWLNFPRRPSPSFSL